MMDQIVERDRYRAKDSRLVGQVFINRLTQIGALSDDDKAALLRLEGDIRDVDRGEDILRPGDRPKHSIGVVSGLLYRYTINRQGQRQIHSFYVPNDTPCLETLHIDVMDNSLAAIVPSRIVSVPHERIYGLMDARPKVLALMWRETLVQAAVFREWLMRNSQMLAHAQMAHFFCEIMARSRAAGVARDDTCDLPITQQDLAEALGMSTVHANRTLMILREGGLADLRGGKLHVLNWPKLAEAAEFDPAYLHLRKGS
jgi:CRP-like cAMP-binding protein